MTLGTSRFIYKATIRIYLPHLGETFKNIYYSYLDKTLYQIARNSNNPARKNIVA